LTLIIEGVLAGNSPATIWVADMHSSRAALMSDHTGIFYLVGDAEDAAAVEALRRHWAEKLYPRALADGWDYLKLVYAPEAWERHIPDLFAPLPLVKRAYVFYRSQQEMQGRKGAEALDHGTHGDGGTRGKEEAILPCVPRPSANFALHPLRPGVGCPSGYVIRRIEREILLSETLPGAAWLREEVGGMWPRLDDFLARGFGFCALRGEKELVGWCTAESVSAGKVGVGIAVQREHQRRGLATAMAAAFMAHCAEQGIVAHWDAWADNVPSVRTAERVGLHRAEEYEVFLWWKRQ
jgi:GNAT superfamily N-acetyltransferase